jgi:hypothetical protein
MPSYSVIILRASRISRFLAIEAVSSASLEMYTHVLCSRTQLEQDGRLPSHFERRLVRERSNL